MSANHILREVEDNKFEFDKFETKFNVKVEGISNIGLSAVLTNLSKKQKEENYENS